MLTSSFAAERRAPFTIRMYSEPAQCLSVEPSSEAVKFAACVDGSPNQAFIPTDSGGISLQMYRDRCLGAESSAANTPIKMMPCSDATRATYDSASRMFTAGELVWSAAQLQGPGSPLQICMLPDAQLPSQEFLIIAVGGCSGVLTLLNANICLRPFFYKAA